MYKSFLLYLLFSALLLPYARGQNYIPMPLDSGATWTILGTKREWLPVGNGIYAPGPLIITPNSVVYEHRFDEGPTTNNQGVVAYKGYVWQNNAVLPGEGDLFLSQDSLQGKIYNHAFFLDGLSGKTPFYDFSLAVGDTFKDYITPGSNKNYFLVDSIKYLPVMGVIRKHLYVHTLMPDLIGRRYMDTWIEGIGSVYGINCKPSYAIIPFPQGELLCLQYKNEVLYMSPLINACTQIPKGPTGPAALAEKWKESTPLGVYPNPIASYSQPTIIGLSQTTPVLFQVIDINGRIVQQTTDKIQTKNLLPALVPGLYQLLVLDNQKKYYSIKFIKD